MKKTAVILLILILGACTGIKRAPQPDPFFDKEKMASIMTDVYLVEGSMTANRNSFIDLGLVPNDYIYKKHGIDSISFKHNFNYYSDRLEEFIEVLDIVDEKLLVIKDSINKRQEKSKPKEVQIDSATAYKLRQLDTTKLKRLDYSKEAK